MRDYLDGILQFIGAESLTDEEFGTVSVTDEADNIAVYNALVSILLSRDSVSDTSSRLKYYFQAKGASVAEPILAKSSIFVGASLE